VSIDTRRALLAAMRLEIATSRTARDETTRLRAVAAAPVAFGAHVAYLPDELAHGGRSFGLTTHLYALRDRRDHGIGDFTTLRRFGETAKSFGGTFAGINPLHHLFPTDRERASPYQPSDRRFVDPIYIDLEPLLSVPSTRAALNADEAEQLRRRHHVDYGGVWRLKRRVLEAAFTAFEAGRHDALFESFVLRGGDALRLHGAFETLAAHFGTVDRGRWSPPLRDPRSSAVAAFAREHERDIRFRAYLQWLADRQLADAAKAAPGLGLYGDLALGVARDSGEVWAAPELFAPGVSIGAPPDPFAADGQNWNLPPFIPHALRAAGFAPLADILGNNMRHFGILRIDHVLGFARQFWIPDGASGPDGAYVTFPLDDLLAITARQSRAANCIVIGEDLGTVPEGLRARLQTANVLSYRMLWFERDGIRFRPPTDYPALSAACLSSHDLVPFLGWAANAPPEERRALIDAIERQGLEAGESAADLMAAAHALVAKSPSALLLVQADDLAGETKPLNVPGTDRERPNWRHRFAGAIEDLPASPLARRVIAAVRKERP
jgi:glycogen operon protein